VGATAVDWLERGKLEGAILWAIYPLGGGEREPLGSAAIDYSRQAAMRTSWTLEAREFAASRLDSEQGRLRAAASVAKTQWSPHRRDHGREGLEHEKQPTHRSLEPLLSADNSKAPPTMGCYPLLSTPSCVNSSLTLYSLLKS
jgi:hypothetical protein